MHQILFRRNRRSALQGREIEKDGTVKRLNDEAATEAAGLHAKADAKKRAGGAKKRAGAKKRKR